MAGLKTRRVVHRRENPFIKYGFIVALVWNALSILGIFFLPVVKTPYSFIWYRRIITLASDANAGGIIFLIIEFVLLAAALGLSVIALIQFINDEEYKLIPATVGITLLCWLNVWFYALTFRSNVMYQAASWSGLCVMGFILSLIIGVAVAYIYYVMEPRERRRKRTSLF